MVLTSGGITKYTVREYGQPRETHTILSSQRLYSGLITTEIFDTHRFKSVMLWGNISQLSGTTGITLNVNTQGSVFGDDNWWGMSGAPRTTTGRWWERTPNGPYTFEASGILNNFTRFQIFSNASSTGGIWTQIDAVFVK